MGNPRGLPQQECVFAEPTVFWGGTDRAPSTLDSDCAAGTVLEAQSARRESWLEDNRVHVWLREVGLPETYLGAETTPGEGSGAWLSRSFSAPIWMTFGARLGHADLCLLVCHNPGEDYVQVALVDSAPSGDRLTQDQQSHPCICSVNTYPALGTEPGAGSTERARRTRSAPPRSLRAGAPIRKVPGGRVINEAVSEHSHAFGEEESVGWAGAGRVPVRSGSLSPAVTETEATRRSARGSCRARTRAARGQSPQRD